MSSKKQKTPFFVYVMAVVAATGGLLFGFDTGVISGAIPFLQRDFSLMDSSIELLTTAGLIGAMIGALVSGRLTDRFGRRIVLLVSGVIFATGAFWSGFASNPDSLICARLFLGIAIGTSSFAVPLYIAEISPTRIRGMLVSMFQLMVTIGILVAYLTDFAFADEANPESWRPMFYVGIIPAIVLFAGMFFMPESPRWLFSRGRDNEAMEVLRRTEGDGALEVASSIRSECLKDAGNSVSFRDLFRKECRFPLLIAIGIAFFEQCVGINTVMYYSPKIFSLAGFGSTQAAIGASIGVGAINVAATVLSVSIVDRIGRRKLYLVGMTGMFISLMLMGSGFLFTELFGEAAKYVIVACTLLYVTFFAVSVGALGWLIISEVFPQRVRGLGSSLGSLFVWIFDALVTFTFFKISKLLAIPGSEITVDSEVMTNPAGSFFLYAAIALAGIIWGIFMVPETKGVPLEKIESHWRNGGTPKKLLSLHS